MITQRVEAILCEDRCCLFRVERCRVDLKLARQSLPSKLAQMSDLLFHARLDQLGRVFVGRFAEPLWVLKPSDVGIRVAREDDMDERPACITRKIDKLHDDGLICRACRHGEKVGENVRRRRWRVGRWLGVVMGDGLEDGMFEVLPQLAVGSVATVVELARCGDEVACVEEPAVGEDITNVRIVSPLT